VLSSVVRKTKQKKRKEKKRENISIYTSGEFFDVRNL
jgi:uncharacterized Fe-S cluster-containing MiaB family protein